VVRCNFSWIGITSFSYQGFSLISARLVLAFFSPRILLSILSVFSSLRPTQKPLPRRRGLVTVRTSLANLFAGEIPDDPGKCLAQNPVALQSGSAYPYDCPFYVA